MSGHTGTSDPASLTGDRVAVPAPAISSAHAELDFDTGMEHYDLRSMPPRATGDTPQHPAAAGGGDIPPLLYAWFSHPRPVMWAADHAVHIEYPLGARLLRRMGPNTVVLNPDYSWSLAVHGSAAEVNADLTELDVRSISFHGSAARIRLRLGIPKGTRTIRCSSLANLYLAHPPPIPVRVELARGANRVGLHGRDIGAAGRGLFDQTSGWDTATDRWLLLASAGVSRLTVITDTTPGCSPAAVEQSGDSPHHSLPALSDP